MKIIRLKTLSIGACFFLACGSAAAEDIDLYAGNNGIPGDLPNVLLVIDNAANFDSSLGQPCTYLDDGTAPSLNNKVAGIIQCSLYNAVLSLPVNSVNMGLMFYSGPTIPDCVGNQGGCLARELQPLTATYKSQFLAWIRTWVTSGSSASNVKANGETTGAAMQEAWAYYAGSTGISGRDYSGIKPNSGCQKNYVVFIANSLANNSSPLDNGSGDPAAALQRAPGVTSDQLTAMTSIAQPDSAHCTINSSYANTLSGHNPTSGLWADEWAKYMQGTDLYGTFDGTQNISTYAIGILGPDCNALFPTLLNSMAKQGGGSYYSAYTGEELFKAIVSILNEVQAVNSVFASASLPVSVNAQGTYLNQIYIGMFRPDAHDKPRWVGNLKQYQFGVDLSTPTSPQLFLADSGLNHAIATDSGFISPNAVSFWTSINKNALPDSLGTNGGFWINDQKGVGLGFDSPDGDLVEKGAVSQQIRLQNLIDDYAQNPGPPSNPRNLYTCTLCASGDNLSNTPFATTNSAITDALLGTGTGSIPISSFSRIGTTMTVALPTAPSPALTVGQSINIVGSTTTALNGAHAVLAVPSPTSFTFAVTEAPPTPSTGTYLAYKGTMNPKTITSLTRVGLVATATVVGHGYVSGQNITISNADPATSAAYNSGHVITVLNADQFTYSITDSPVSPGSGGTATASGTTATIDSLTRTSTTGTLTAVTVITVANIPAQFVPNATITISGATPAEFNLPNAINTTTKITAIGTACGGGGNPNKKFCFTMNTFPATPAVAQNGLTLTADTTISYPVAFTHPAASCPSSVVTVTGTTTNGIDHNFKDDDTVNISGTPGVNEGAYLGAFTVSGVTPKAFNIGSFPISPACTPSAAGARLLPNLSSVDRTALINWIRGEDSVGDEFTPGSHGINVRGSVHGDVLHSRPAIVNYGNGKIVAFYGSNDGVFRAVNARQNGNIGATPPGGEIWGFIPKEFYSKLARQYLNSPPVKLFTTPASVQAEQKPYFFDGEVGVYQTASGDKVYIYLSARRGGRLIYALDVTDPESPIFLWKKGCTSLTDSTTCDAGFQELGQTWSAPKPATVAGVADPVLIFAAGNDAYEDQEPPGAGGSPAPDTMGRGVFILNALNGAIVWKAGPGGSADRCTGGTETNTCALASMTYAMPADVALIDRNFDGKVDRAYASDMGGNIWRIDLPATSTSPSDWLVTKFAALGGEISDPIKRKFFFAPDVVASKGFDMVLASTGDREHPLKLNTGSFSTINRYYALKDFNNGVGTNPATPPSTWVPIADSTSSTATAVPPDLFNCSACTSGGAAYDNSGRGFYINLLASGGTNATGEKGVNGPASIGGFTYFATNEPKPSSATSCVSNLGTARGYKVRTFTGQAARTEFNGGGLPPSPVVGMVTVTLPGATTPTVMPFLIGGGTPGSATPDALSPIGGQFPQVLLSGTRQRKFWYIEHDR